MAVGKWDGKEENYLPSAVEEEFSKTCIPVGISWDRAGTVHQPFPAEVSKIMSLRLPVWVGWNNSCSAMVFNIVYVVFLMYAHKKPDNFEQGHPSSLSNWCILLGPTVFRVKIWQILHENLVNSSDHRGKTDEIPVFTAAAQVKFRDLIKSFIDKSNTWYELMNSLFFIN